MSALMSFVHGAAKAGSEHLNRYITEEIAMQRAEAMAELQRRTANNIRQDDATFRDQRAPIERKRAQDDALAAASTADQIEFGRLDPNSALSIAKAAAAERQAADARRRLGDDIRELSPLKAEAEGQLATARETAQTAAMEARLPMEVKRAAQLAEAQARASAKYRDRPQTAAEKLDGIEKALGRPLKQEEREAFVLGQRGGEYDTVKITDEKLNPDGTTTKTERTERRRPGAEQPAQKDPRAVAAEAVAAGKGPDLVKRMESQGLSPADIVHLIGADEYSKIKGTNKPKGSSLMNAEAKDPIQMASNRDLQRIAAIEGHAQQKAALAELARRKANEPEVDTSGFGYGAP